MTEIAASLIGIATFGIKLTTTLYEFGANAASAREQTDRIARHLRLYSEVLEVLVVRIDDGEPIHSAKALSLVDEIYDQSYDLFDDIKNLIPQKGVRMSFMRKLAWNFKKSRVALVVSEIEYLKSTVTLLVTVLFAGRKIRSSRRKTRSKKESKKDREEVDRECAKVKIAIVEQMNASAHKLDMQVKVEEEERNEPSLARDSQERALIRPGAGVLQHSLEIVKFRESLGRTEDQGEERALVLNHSADLIANLLDQWTTLADDATNPSVAQGDNGFGDSGASKISQPNQGSENLVFMDDNQHGEATISNISNKLQGEASREENHRNMLTEAYLDVRNRAERAEEELARLKASLQDSRKTTTPENIQPSENIYFAASSSDSDVSHYIPDYGDNVAEICESDGRNIRESIEAGMPRTRNEIQAESRWYDQESERLRGQHWSHSDDEDEQKWKAHQKRRLAEMVTPRFGSDGMIEARSTVRNQDRATYPRTPLNDDARLHPKSRVGMTRGAAMMAEMWPTGSPRTRVAAASSKKFSDPKLGVNANEEQTANRGMGRPPPNSDRLRGDQRESSEYPEPRYSGREDPPVNRTSKQRGKYEIVDPEWYSRPVERPSRRVSTKYQIVDPEDV
ncbi:hypothetical protein LTR84_009646 [Exophiala bonariae]|uniref:Fungal N-terminal domain-containing protein n=1 Tax=Exophiala bonariae TaxID=1690606 RepID=A0AAV9NJC4_9EURO|nr:hypothetical protein LTR84_009646 [Exophiala bonariae]